MSSTSISEREQYWIDKIKEYYPEFESVQIRVTDYTISVLDAIGIEHSNLFVSKGFNDNKFELKGGNSYTGEYLDGAVTLKIASGLGLSVGKYSGLTSNLGLNVSVGGEYANLKIDIVDLVLNQDLGSLQPTVKIFSDNFGSETINTSIKLSPSIDDNGGPNGYTGTIEIGGEKFKIFVQGGIKSDDAGNYYFYESANLGTELPPRVTLLNDISLSASQTYSSDVFTFKIKGSEYRNSGIEGSHGLGGNRINSYSDVVYDLIKNNFAGQVKDFDITLEDFKFLLEKEYYNAETLDATRAMARVLAKLFNDDLSWFNENHTPGFFDWTAGNGSTQLPVPEGYFEDYINSLLEENPNGVRMQVPPSELGSLSYEKDGEIEEFKTLAAVPEEGALNTQTLINDLVERFDDITQDLKEFFFGSSGEEGDADAGTGGGDGTDTGSGDAGDTPPKPGKKPEHKIYEDDTVAVTVTKDDGSTEIIRISEGQIEIATFSFNYEKAVINGIVLDEFTEIIYTTDGSSIIKTSHLIQDANGDRYEVVSLEYEGAANGVKSTQLINRYSLNEEGVYEHHGVQQNTISVREGNIYQIAEHQESKGSNWSVQQKIITPDGQVLDDSPTFVVPSDGLLESLQQAGTTAGGLLADYLADDDAYKSIVYNAVLKTIGHHFGTVTAFIAAGGELDAAVRAGFGEEIIGVQTQVITPEFMDTFYSNLSSGVSSALSNIIVNEVGESLGIDGTVVGEVFEVAAGTITTGIIKGGFDIVFNQLDDSLYGNILNGQLNFSDTIPLEKSIIIDGKEVTSVSVGDYLQFQVYNAVAAYTGGRLAGEIVEPESQHAAIFGALGSAYASAVGATIAASSAGLTASISLSTAITTAFSSASSAVAAGAAAGSIVPIIGTAIGAFIGTIAGTFLGNLFGGSDSPQSWAKIGFNYEDGEFVVGQVWEKDGGGTETARSMAQATADAVNSIVEATGGYLRPGSGAPTATLGRYRSSFQSNAGGDRSYDRSGDAIEHTAFHLLKKFDLVGAHAIIMRAWHNSDAKNIHDFQKDLEVAEAFQLYLANPTGILAMMMDQPDSNLAQSWARILERAAELELHLPHERDLEGGWNDALLRQGVDPEFVPQFEEDTIVVINENGEKINLSKILGPGYEIVTIEGTDGNDVISVNIDGGQMAYVDAKGGDDVIEGSDFADVILGGDGDDTIVGKKGHDWIHGQGGDDTIEGNGGDDHIVGGSGNDVLTGSEDNDVIFGGDGDDIINGVEGKDILYGGDGDDEIHGGGAPWDPHNNIIYDGNGNDRVFLNRGDKLYLGKGDDTISFFKGSTIYVDRGSTGSKFILTSSGNQNINHYIEFSPNISPEELSFYRESDSIRIRLDGEDLDLLLTSTYSSKGSQNIVLRFLNQDWGTNSQPKYKEYSLTGRVSENDPYDVPLDFDFKTSTKNGSYSSGSGDIAELVQGSDGDDIIRDNKPSGDQAKSWFYGNGGNDEIHLGHGENIGVGGTGDDSIYGGMHNDTIYGGSGSDYLVSGEGNDEVYGGSGDDSIIVSGGNNVIYGGHDNDQITIQDGNNQIYGDDGDDTIVALGGGSNIAGGNGNDVITAGLGEDTVFGGEGDDTLVWVGGSTIMAGGEGADSFSVRYHEDAQRLIITDFNVEEGDKLDLSDSAWDFLTYNQLMALARQDGDNVLIEYSAPSTSAPEEIVTVLDIVLEDFRLENLLNENIQGNASFLIKLEGSSSDDVLEAPGEAREIYGYEGDDILHASDGRDILHGGLGNDTIYGKGGNDVLDGGLGNDTLYGQDGADRFVIVAEGGSIDQIMDFGRDSGDAIDITEFADQFEYFEHIKAALTQEDGSHVRLDLTSDQGAQTLHIHGVNINQLKPEHFIINGESVERMPVVYGTSEDETLSAYSTSILHGLEGNDSLLGSSGSDILYGDEGNDNLYANDGNDTLYGGAGYDRLYGHGGDDILHGGEGNDTLNGGEGNDTLHNSSGIDHMYGNKGADTFVISASPEAWSYVRDFSAADGDKIDISAFANQYKFFDDLQAAFSPSGSYKTNVELTSVFGSQTLQISLGSNQISADHFVINGQAMAERLLVGGTSGADTLEGTGSSEILNGDAGNDILFGHDGSDVLNGGYGDDILHGGDGIDRYDGGAGDDLLDFRTLEAPDDEDNDSSGGLIFGGPPTAGEDDEPHAPSPVGVSVDIAQGIAVDTQGNAETFINIESARGTDYADILRGDDGANRLYGEDGDDELFGGAGDDLLNGGLGDDILDAGTGNDVLWGRGGSDTFIIGKAPGKTTVIKDFNVHEVNEKINLQQFNARFTDFAVLLAFAVQDLNHVHIDLGDGQTLTLEHTALNHLKPSHFVGAASLRPTIYGTDESENVIGTDQHETLRGLGGDDYMFGQGGDDEMYGDEGNDTLYGKAGNDGLYGGNGDDRLYAHEGDDHLHGGAGSDRLSGMAGNDIMYGGADNDWLHDPEGSNELYGEEGNDALHAGDGDDLLDGGAGNDYLDAGAGNDRLYGGAGKDKLYGKDGMDELYGGDGDDHLDGGDGLFDKLYGGAGNDWLQDYAGYFSELHGGDGNDVLKVGDFGGDLYGDAGDDRMYGGAINEIMSGGEGSDRLYGRAGDDHLYGDPGRDYLHGEDGNDRLWGGSGVDVLYGGAGNDWMSGGLDHDIYFTGEGEDTLFFRRKEHGETYDRVTDFDLENDTIDISDLLEVIDYENEIITEMYNPETDDINDFVKIRDFGNASMLYVDLDGAGVEFEMSAVLRMENVTGVTAQDMIDNGSLVI